MKIDWLSDEEIVNWSVWVGGKVDYDVFSELVMECEGEDVLEEECNEEEGGFIVSYYIDEKFIEKFRESLFKLMEKYYITI